MTMLWNLLIQKHRFACQWSTIRATLHVNFFVPITYPLKDKEAKRAEAAAAAVPAKKTVVC